MPVRRKFNKEDIVMAAFNVVRKNGWEKCTARTIAKELNASTMPIYSHITSMTELKAEIAMKAADLMVDYQKKKRTDVDFLNIGVGYIVFAREEKHLFRLLFFSLTEDEDGNTETKADEKNAIVSIKTYAFELLLDYLSTSEILSGFTRKEKEKILYKMWIFTHGLAVLINNGRIADATEKEITDLMVESGLYVIEGAKIWNKGSHKNNFTF